MALRPNSYHANNASAAVGGGGGGSGQQRQQPTIANQFQAWTSEKDRFKTAALKANEERQQLEQKLLQIRNGTKQVNENILRANNVLGNAHRQRDMLTKEKKRLETQLANERGQLEKCAADNESLNKQTKECTVKQLKEIQELNDELGSLLTKQNDYKLQNLISFDTLPILRQWYEKNVLVGGNNGSGMGPTEEAAAPSPDSVEESNGEMAELEDACRGLVDRTNSYNGVAAKREKLQSMLDKFRARAMQLSKDGTGRQEADGNNSNQPCLTMADLNELEAAWLQEDYVAEEDAYPTRSSSNAIPSSKPTPNQTPQAVEPVHVQLFYSNSKNMMDDSIEEEEDECGGQQQQNQRQHDGGAHATGEGEKFGCDGEATGGDNFLQHHQEQQQGQVDDDYEMTNNVNTA